MLDITTISTIVAAVSVVIGVVFTVMEVRHMARTRRTDVIMRIYDRFASKEIVEAMSSINQVKADSSANFSQRDRITGAIEVAILFEELGILLEQHLIDIKLLNNFFGPTLESLWVPMQPLIKGMRESMRQPFFFSHFELLHDRLVDYRRATANNP